LTIVPTSFSSQKKKEVNKLCIILLLFFSFELQYQNILIKMKKQTFEELFCQNYYCLKWKDIQKTRNENVRFELVNMEDNIIKSDKDVKRKFKKTNLHFNNWKNENS
ncbi:hypothetical protein RFI_37403, partial [Reticulomyxa filosa]